MSDINLQPLGNRMVVEIEDKEETTKGGLILTTLKDEGITTGKVIAIGKGKHNEKGKYRATTTEVGTRILFNLGSGEKFKYNYNEYVWLEEQEIIGVLS